MTDDELDRLVRLAVDRAPTLTSEQITELRRLLKPWEWIEPKPVVASSKTREAA